MKSFFSFFCLSVICLVGFLFFGFRVEAAGSLVVDGNKFWYSGDYQLNATTTWHSGEIHIIADSSYIIVNPNITLNIEPGVIVKSGKDGAFRIYGHFSAIGNQDNPIYFTSLKDDSIGGDTNNDGSATSMGLSDWSGFTVDGNRYKSSSTLDLSYAVVKGGSYVFFIFSASKFNISNCNIINNAGGASIDSNTKNISIINSNIYNPDYCNYSSSTDMCHQQALWKFISKEYIDLRNNYWGSEFGPTYTTGTIPTLFKGVVLANLFGGNMTYQPYATLPFDFKVKKINPVILIPGIMGSAEVPIDTGGSPLDKTEYALALDPILHTYDDLWQALKNAGYKEGETLFAFPYEWRYSNVISAQGLKKKIDEVKAKCNCDKVDLIGHSMGGLVAREYIESDYYGGDVDQLIFLATPHKGAPKAYLMWEAGEFGFDIKSRLMKNFLQLESSFHLCLGSNGLFNYIRDFGVESVRELLPIYNYLIEKESNELRNYSENYPVNLFLENLNSPSKIVRLKEVKILNIIANNNFSNTPVSFKVVSSSDSNIWEYGMPDNYYGIFGAKGVVYGEGDQTVPEVSNKGMFNNEIVVNSDHTKIVTDAQKAVIKELTGSEPENEVRSSLAEKVLMVRIFSPADFQIISPSGKRLGKDFSANRSINEIGGYYSGFDRGAEWAVITNPEDGEYKVQLKGTGEGEYRLSLSAFSDSVSVDRDFKGQIENNENQVFNIEMDNDSQKLIKELIPEDTISPVIDFLSPSSTLKYYHHEKLKIDFTVSDDFSGVSSTAIFLDSKEIVTTTIDLFDLSLGAHIIKVVALDRVGNIGEKEIFFNITSSFESIMGDIEIGYQRGLIKDLKIKNLLINELKVIKLKIDLGLKAIELAEKARQAIIENKYLNERAKQKLLEVNNKLIEKLKSALTKEVNLKLSNFLKTVDKYVKKGQIEASFYDIIKKDLEYCKIIY